MGYSGHKKREYQRQWLADRRNRAVILLGGCCSWCSSVKNLEIDHIIPAINEGYSSPGGKMWSWAWARIEQELAKCQLLCEDCHKKKTFEEQRGQEHGTAAGYCNRKCRCVSCREYMKLYKRDYRARRAASRETANPPASGVG